MPENPTPRQIAKQILQGGAPPRPLLAPIVFALGAKIENLPLPAFLENPTKISNALRHIRPRLRSDGVTCYFDPLLEVEALGATLAWQSNDKPPAIHWPQPARRGELPAGLRSPEDAAKANRVQIALEVIRRMAATRRDDSLLFAAVSGPGTLAARLTQLTDEPDLRFETLPSGALDLAAATITQLATAFVEAGANLVFIQEDFLPALSASAAKSWSSLLSPLINIIRFYEAVPALQITSAVAFHRNSDAILSQSWECVLCAPLDALQQCAARISDSAASIPLGAALPPEAFHPAQAENSAVSASAAAPFRDILSTSGGALLGRFHPVLLTTSADSSAAPANQIRSIPE